MFKLRQKRAPRVLPQQKWRRKKGLQFWIGLLSIDVMIDLIFVQDQTPNRRISRIPWLSLEIFNLIPNLSNPTRVAWWNWLPYELGVVLIFSAPWKINECPPPKKKTRDQFKTQNERIVFQPLFFQLTFVSFLGSSDFYTSSKFNSSPSTLMVGRQTFPFVEQTAICRGRFLLNF